MDFLRMKKMLAGISVAAVALTQVGTALAAYSDVPSGVWFGDAVESFVDAGYLDSAQSRFRPGDLANRAEFVKLVVELNGGILSTPPAVASFDDAATGAWFYGYFEEAGKEGWVRGDANCYGKHPCYARPSANINRAEAAALIVRAFNLEWTGAAPQFVDNPSGQWYTDAIQTAADSCVLQGDDSTGRVRPSDNMNRAEMVTMLHRVDQGLTFGVDCGEEDMGAEPMVKKATATSSTTVEVEFNMALDAESAEDTGNYTVTNSGDVPVSAASQTDDSVVELTLGEAMSAGHEYTLAVDGVMTDGGDEVSDSVTFAGYTELVKGDGVLEVSLSSANPVGDTLPKGAIGAVMLSADFTASCDDSVSIEHVTILHEGFGQVADIDGVYAAINGARVSRKRTLDSEDQTADIRFSSPLIVDSCETVTVDVVTDFNSTASTSAEHNLVIELPSDVFGNAKDVTGNFPLRGNTFRIAAVTSGIVTIAYRTVSPDQVEVGDTGVVIGKFEVSVNSTEDQTFYSLTLEQNSSASDGDFNNIAIRRTDGTVLTNTVAQSVGDFVTLVFDPPFTVLEGDKITLEIIADITGGAGDSMIMHFEEASDIFAVGSLYGYGVNGQLYGSQIALPATDNADTVSIDAGEFTIGIDGPASTDFTRDDNDAILANITFKTGGEKIDVKDLFIAVQAATSTGGGLPNVNTTSTQYDNVAEVLEDVEMRNTKTGRTIDGVRLTASNDLGTDSTDTFQVYRFDDFVVTGDESWEFRVDFIDNGSGNHPKSGDKFKVHICGEPTDVLDSSNTIVDNTTGCSFGGLTTSSESYQMRVEGLSTGDKVGDVRPRGNIAGNFHRVADATLNVTVKSIGETDTAVENAKNVGFLRFEARAGEAEDILLTKLIFTSDSGSIVNAQNYTLWVDTDGNGTVDTILEDGVASQGSNVTFADLVGGGYVVPAEETVLFELHGDVSSSIVTTLNSMLQVRFATGATNFIEAEELDDGSALSNIKQNPAACATTTCDIIFTTVRSQRWNLRNQGDLFLTQDSTPLRSRQLLGGTLGEAILRVQFHAENEAVDVHGLNFTSSGSNASSVDRLELYKEGESAPFALATSGGCGQRTVSPNQYIPSLTYGATSGAVVTFCASMQNRQLIVPEGQDLDVIIRPRMKTDIAGGTTNQHIAFYVDPTHKSDDSQTGSGAVRARGDESSNPLDANDGDTSAEGEIFVGLTSATTNNVQITGNGNVSVLAKISSITNANPDANGSAVPNGLSNIGQFKIAAAAHGNTKDGLNDVILSGVIFNVNATNVSITGNTFKFYNKANATVKHSCTAHYATAVTFAVAITGNASGSLLVNCSDIPLGSAVQTEIDQGSDQTFVLEATITNPNTSTTNSSLQVSIQSFDNARVSGSGIGASGESHLTWRDKDQAASQIFRWVEYPETVVKSTSYAG
ncbi:MAG: putative Ca2+-binding protein [Candidatus Peregrinibacteria bacterium Greene0416_62]|nr:MAG: putative Ca2+-binding protein [Candidatus Peregrinibacteria bacterium Greene0416_62]TSC98695.1 MAG: putative Ca2+-binding protein [Candidatus Peregrinibacteria bacterium Greene1014_49]